MPRDWFSTRGQIIQVVCAFLGLCLGIFIAWPQLNARMDIASAWPIVVYPLAIFATFQLGKDFGNTAATDKTEPTAQQTAELFSPIIKMGSYWENGSSFSRIRITAKSIQKTKSADGDDILMAELHFDSGGVIFFVGGSKTKTIQRNRLLLPISRSGFHNEDASAFTFSTSENHISFVVVRVDHINEHAQEVSLAIARQNASSIVPS